MPIYVRMSRHFLDFSRCTSSWFSRSTNQENRVNSCELGNMWHTLWPDWYARHWSDCLQCATEGVVQFKGHTKTCRDGQSAFLNTYIPLHDIFARTKSGSFSVWQDWILLTLWYSAQRTDWLRFGQCAHRYCSDMIEVSREQHVLKNPHNLMSGSLGYCCRWRLLPSDIQPSDACYRHFLSINPLPS